MLIYHKRILFISNVVNLSEHLLTQGIMFYTVHSTNMELLESVAWIAIGFVPTLVLLNQIVTQRSRKFYSRIDTELMRLLFSDGNTLETNKSKNH